MDHRPPDIKRYSRAILAIGPLALVFLLLGLLRPREPVFDGKPLSYWIAESGQTNPPRAAEARRILHHNAPHAVRFLLDAARAESSFAHQLYGRVWSTLPARLRDRLPSPHYKDDCLTRIYTALHRLGPAARTELTKALKDPNEDVRYVAGASFPYPADDLHAAVEWHIKLLRLADYELRQASALTLGTMGTNAYAAVPALLDTVQNDSIDYIRETAARSLARLAPGIPPELIPRLKKSLQDPVKPVRIWSAVILWRTQRDPEALSLLIFEFQRGGDPFATPSMLTAFAEAGSLAAPVIPELEQIIDSPARFTEQADYMANAAREALSKITSGDHWAVAE